MPKKPLQYTHDDINLGNIELIIADLKARYPEYVNEVFNDVISDVVSDDIINPQYFHEGMHQSNQASNKEHPQKSKNTCILVSAVSQKLTFIQAKNNIASYPISTAEAGLGNQLGSYQTPLGLHRVAEKLEKMLK